MALQAAIQYSRPFRQDKFKKKIVDLLTSQMKRFPLFQVVKRLENGSKFGPEMGGNEGKGGRMGTLVGRVGTLDGRVGILDGMTGTMDGRMRTLERAPGEMMGKRVGGGGGVGGTGGVGGVRGNCLAIRSYALGSPARLSGPLVSQYHHITASTRKPTHGSGARGGDEENGNEGLQLEHASQWRCSWAVGAIWVGQSWHLYLFSLFL